MEFLILLVKILLGIKVLNIDDKTCKASIITRNRGFRKIAGEIGFRSISPVLARHTPLSSPRVLLYHPSPNHSNHYPINLALHTKQTTLAEF